MRPYILTLNKDPRLSGVVSLFIQDDATETIKGRRLRYQKRASKRYSTLSGEQRETDDGCNAKKKPVLKLYMTKKKPVLKLYRIDKSAASSPQVETSSPALASAVSTKQEDSLKQKPGDHIIQEPKDHIIQEPEDHLKQEPEDHIIQEPEDHLIQEPQDHLIQEPQDHLIQEPQDHLIQEPQDHLIQEPQDHLIQEPQDHIIQEPQDHHLIQEPEDPIQEPEDHLIQEPEDHHLQQEPEEDPIQEPEDHLIQEPVDHLKQEPDKHLKQKLEDPVKQAPSNHFQHEFELYLEQKLEDRPKRPPKDHLEQESKDHLKQETEKHPKQESNDYLKQETEKQPVQEPQDHLKQESADHLKQTPEDHLCDNATLPQPVPVVTPQGQPVTVSPRSKHVQTNQNPNLVGDVGDGSPKKCLMLSKQVTSVLNSWLLQHDKYPYPTEYEKKQMATQTNLTLAQVNNWFVRARRRILQRILNPPTAGESGSSERAWFIGTKQPTPQKRPLQHACPAGQVPIQRQVTTTHERPVASSLQAKMSSPTPASSVSIKQESEDHLIHKPEHQLKQNHEDHLYAYQSVESSLQVKMSTPSPASTFGPELPGRGKRQKQFPRHFQDFNLVTRAPKGNVSTPPEPLGNSTNREDFLKYSFPLSLDPNTTGKYLQLLEQNRKVVATLQNQSYPDHPERFSRHEQVLSRESLPERCYFEVEWVGYLFGVAVSYKDIDRKGEDLSVFGYNKKSWRLDCEGGASGFTFTHDSVPTYGQQRCSSRVGVYVDRKAGVLSFYSVTDNTMTLLHSVRTTFTKPLYAGLWLFGIAEFCNT